MPTVALTFIPKRESSISIVNFLISFFFTSLLIRLYMTEALIPSFLDNVGTEIEPSRVNSKSNFISNSSNLCKILEKPGNDLIYVGFEQNPFEILNILLKICNFLELMVLRNLNL